MITDKRDYLPTASRLLQYLIRPLNCLFDTAYTSRYNPLYRSGTFAVLLLAVVIATGFYLLFFYRVGTPYESMVGIQEQVYLGRWIRALHRYATDATVIVLVFHVLQLLAQGRTWGPRLLAWLSGVILLAAMSFSAWTGYVLVWDKHGQLVASAGAELLKQVPFLRDTVVQAFDGSNQVSSAFFFMNLFLHVAIPLGMIFGLWVHTSKLARALWFPPRSAIVTLCLLFALLSMVWPVPLPPAANLLELIGRVPSDIFFGFWLPWAASGSPLWAWTVLIGLAMLLTSFTWWWRPTMMKRLGASWSNPETCVGCGQCTEDCPFEAITLAPPRPDKKLGHAVVNPQSCVSCGVCGGSCDSHAIGPPGRSALHQIETLAQFTSDAALGPGDVVFIYCSTNPGASEIANTLTATRPNLKLYPVECCGTVHMDLLNSMLTTCAGVFVWGCPEHNCMARDGIGVMRDRLSQVRAPSLSRKLEKHRVALLPASETEHEVVKSCLDAFTVGLTSKQPQPVMSARPNLPAAAVVTATLLAAVGFGTRMPLGQDPQHGVVRISMRIPGRAVENCRTPSAEEQSNIPAHMRQHKICQQQMLDYQLNAIVDGRAALNKPIAHSGARGDRPIIISEDIELVPGQHHIQVEVAAQDAKHRPDTAISYSGAINVERSKIALLAYDPVSKGFQVR